jgi:hypothetical protein
MIGTLTTFSRDTNKQMTVVEWEWPGNFGYSRVLAEDTSV